MKLWIVAFIALVSVDCTSPANPGAEPAELAAADAGETRSEDSSPPEINHRLPISPDDKLSPVAKLWQAGATQFVVREQRWGECEGKKLEVDACLDEEEWQLERPSRRLVQLICRCGQVDRREKVLNPREFAEFETAINALSAATAPPACASDAPQVSIELRTAQGHKESFAVNYGQCALSFAPRIDLLSFENLIGFLGRLER